MFVVMFFWALLVFVVEVRMGSIGVCGCAFLVFLVIALFGFVEVGKT